MLEAITTGVTTLITLTGDVIEAIFDTAGAWKSIMPAVGLSIAFGVIGFGVRTLKSLTWGF